MFCLTDNHWEMGGKMGNDTQQSPIKRGGSFESNDMSNLALIDEKNLNQNQ